MCPFPAPLAGWSARDLSYGRNLRSASRSLGQEGVENVMGGDGPGGCDTESSEPQALPWEPDLKGAEEKNLLLVPHLCPSARDEGQLDEDKGGFSTGFSFCHFWRVPRAREAAMAAGTFYPPLTCVGLHLKPPHGTSLATRAQLRAALLPLPPAAPVWGRHWDSPGGCKERRAQEAQS